VSLNALLSEMGLCIVPTHRLPQGSNGIIKKKGFFVCETKRPIITPTEWEKIFASYTSKD
jgi:hypothetical protein